MIWDGTYIGKIDKKDIIEIIKFNKETYWKLKHKSETFYCLAKQSKNTFPCIIDRLKPIFNIPALGTHHCRLGSKIYILIRVISKSSNINVDIKLNELTVNDPDFVEKVKYIFAFRELLGITVSTGNSIRVRENTNETKSDSILDHWDPISFREPNFSFEKSIISKKTLKTIFNNEYRVLLKYIHHILGIKNKKMLKESLVRLSLTLENEILKVDHNAGWISNELMMRFNSFFSV